PFQSGHFHPPSSPDTFTPFQSGHFPPLPVRTLSPPFQSGHFHLPSSPETFPPFQSGHFPPLPVRTLSPPSSPDTFPPFQVQANFQLSALSNLNDNCAVMQHCTHINFLTFF
ncbi:unnamed protein product, partial [Staurois parvus]